MENENLKIQFLIFELMGRGFSYSEIARQIGVSRQAIHRRANYNLKLDSNLFRQTRNRIIIRCVENGMTYRQIAGIFNVCHKTVWKVIQ